MASWKATCLAVNVGADATATLCDKESGLSSPALARAKLRLVVRMGLFLRSHAAPSEAIEPGRERTTRAAHKRPVPDRVVPAPDVDPAARDNQRLLALCLFHADCQ
jgi:hypothetical protein